MNDRFTLIEIINRSIQYLIDKGVPNPKCDVEWIISHVTRKKKLDLYLEFENLVEKNDVDKIRSCIVKRGKRIPLQHILGRVNFAGNEIICDQRALIPRPETEYFTELIKEKLNTNFQGTILDLGTGSGVIIITLCIDNDKCIGIGMDNSISALNLASENIAMHNLTNVKLKKFDWNYDNFDTKYEVIVANPPYLSIEEWNTTEPEVREFDPQNALVAKNRGLGDIFKIIKHAIEHLTKDGVLALEIGLGQKSSIVDKMKLHFYNVEIKKDLSQRERFIFANKR